MPLGEVPAVTEVRAKIGNPGVAGITKFKAVVPTFFGPAGTVGVPVPTRVTGHEFVNVLFGVASQAFEGMVEVGVAPSAGVTIVTIYRRWPVPYAGMGTGGTFDTVLKT